MELHLAYCPCVKKCADCADYRLMFWDTVKDKYNVDMSALKPYALKCLLDQINVQDVNSEDVMAEPAEICSYLLASVKLPELPDIEVNRGFTRGVQKVLQLDHKEDWKCYKQRFIFPNNHY